MGFASPGELSLHLKVKDIPLTPVDWSRIRLCARRIFGVLTSLNGKIMHPRWRRSPRELASFRREVITKTVALARPRGVVERMNNEGRHRDGVFVDWLFGHAIGQFFSPVIAKYFGVPPSAIEMSGTDCLNRQSFYRSSRAAMKIRLPDSKEILVEVLFTLLQALGFLLNHATSQPPRPEKTARATGQNLLISACACGSGVGRNIRNPVCPGHALLRCLGLDPCSSNAHISSDQHSAGNLALVP